MKNQNVLNPKKITDALVQELMCKPLIKKTVFIFLLLLSIIFINGCKNINKDFTEAYSKSDTVQMLALIKAGANINSQNKNQETPLHIECKKCIQLEKLYFELKKAKIMLPDDDINDQIKEVDQQWVKCIKMISFLLDNKADLDVKNAEGKSPFNLVDEAKAANCLGLLSGYKLNQMLDKNKKENK
jgi:ankyrin repeat protein